MELYAVYLMMEIHLSTQFIVSKVIVVLKVPVEINTHLEMLSDNDNNNSNK